MRVHGRVTKRRQLARGGWIAVGIHPGQLDPAVPEIPVRIGREIHRRPQDEDPEHQRGAEDDRKSAGPDSPAARDKPERQQVERDGNAEHGQMQAEGFEPEPRRQGYHQGIHAGRQGSEPREADASGAAPHARSQVKKSRSRDQLPGAVRASQGRRSASKPQTRPAAENAKQNWGRVSSTQIQYHSPGTLKAPSAILTCQRNPPIPASRVRRPSSRPSPSAISTTKVM